MSELFWMASSDDDARDYPELALHAERTEDGAPVVTATEFRRFIAAWQANDPNGAWWPEGVAERVPGQRYEIQDYAENLEPGDAIHVGPLRFEVETVEGHSFLTTVTGLLDDRSASWTLDDDDPVTFTRPHFTTAELIYRNNEGDDPEHWEAIDTNSAGSFLYVINGAWAWDC